MKNTKPLLPSLALLAMLVAPLGCASEADAADAEGAAEDDLTSSPATSKLLGKVYAVRIDGQTLGTKSKVDAVLKAMTLGARDEVPAPVLPQTCRSPHPIDFLGPDGAPIATGQVSCRPQTSGVSTAYVSFDARTYALRADLDSIFAQMRRPLQAGDLLYGVDGIAISYGAGDSRDAHATSTERRSVSGALAAVGTSIEKTTTTDGPPCGGVTTLEFLRSGEVAATLRTCSATRGTAQGKLSDGDGRVVGLVKVDMGRLEALRSSLRFWRQPPPR